MPMKVTGSNSDPNWGSLSSYNALTGAMQTINLTKDFTMGGDGNILSNNISDGMHSVKVKPLVESLIMILEMVGNYQKKLDFLLIADSSLHLFLQV